MDVKLQTDKISLKSVNFSDFVKDVLKKKEEVVKTAEVEEVKEEKEVEEVKEEVKEEEKDKEAETETEEVKTAEVEEKEEEKEVTAEEEKEEEKEAETETEEVKTAKTDEAESSGQPEAEGKLVNVPKKDDGKGGKADNKEAETSGQTDVEPLHQTGESEHGGDLAKGKKKSANSKFIRIAKLNPKTKDFLRKYWSTLFPEDYVDAMLAEQ